MIEQSMEEQVRALVEDYRKDNRDASIFRKIVLYQADKIDDLERALKHAKEGRDWPVRVDVRNGKLITVECEKVQHQPV